MNAEMIQQWTTSNGVPVYFIQNHTLPMVDINIAFYAGSSADPQHQHGLANMTAELFASGTTGMSENDIIDRISDLGVFVGSEVTKDLNIVSIRTRSDSEILPQSIELLSQCFSQATFRMETLTRVKSQLAVGFNYDMQNPSKVASKIFMNTLYQNHPYAHGSAGDLESIQSIDLASVEAFYQTHYHYRRAKIVMVGDMATDIAQQHSEQISQSLPHKQTIEMGAKTTLATFKPQSVYQMFDSQQTTVMCGHYSIAKGDPNFFSLSVGNHILGGSGLNSRLFNTVRKEQGLAYSVYSGMQTYAQGGTFVMKAQTADPQAALSAMKALYHDFVTTAVSATELKAAKDYLIGSYVLGLVKNSDQADMLTMLAMYNLPLNYADIYVEAIQKVTAESIMQAYQAINPQQQLLEVLVGHLDETK